jgi:hypothetical protein
VNNGWREVETERRKRSEDNERGKHAMSGGQRVTPILAGTRQSVYISREIPIKAIGKSFLAPITGGSNARNYNRLSSTKQMNNECECIEEYSETFSVGLRNQGSPCQILTVYPVRLFSFQTIG